LVPSAVVVSGGGAIAELPRLSVVAQPDFPDFYIVGAPKCGTTAMYQFLRSHPELYLPATKELIYFGSDLSYRSRLSREDFLEFFRDRRGERHAGTAHTAYLQSRLAAREIHRARPDASILIMLRNPVDVLPAWHSELLYESIEDLADLESALAAEAERRRGARIPKNAANSYVEALFYTDVASFSDQVRRYIEVFGRDRVRVIVYDDFCRDPASEYRTALQFLGVDPGFQPVFSVINPNRTARSRALQQVLFHSTGRVRKVAKRVVPGSLRRGIITLNTRHVARPEISASLRLRLNDVFRADVSRLSELLERDLSHWVDER